MSELYHRLDGLGLAEYTQRFLDERFDTWRTLSDITEQDLQDLGVKLGHRRKLQRAISEWRRQTKEAALTENGVNQVQFEPPTNTAPTDSANGDQSGSAQTAAGSNGAEIRTKRKYRRHPKPDANAPERPPSAYVIFSNHVRELLKDQDLSFTEMAKVVGERWQVLPMPDREEFKNRAAAAKDKYTSELNWYKKTDNYCEYQTYLKAFKAKAAGQTLDSKRLKYDVDSGEEPHNHGSPPLKRRHSSSASSAASSASEGPSVPDAYSKITSSLKETTMAPSQSPVYRGFHASPGRTSRASSSTSRPDYAKYGDVAPKFGPTLKSFASDGSRSEADTTVRYASIGPSSYGPQQQIPAGPPTSASMYPFGFGKGGQSNPRFNLPYAAPNPKNTPETTSASTPSTPFESMFTSDIPPSRRILPVPVSQSFTNLLSAEFRPPLAGDPGRRSCLRHDSSKSSNSVLESVVESPIDTLLRASELVRDSESALSPKEVRSPPHSVPSKPSSRGT